MGATPYAIAGCPHARGLGKRRGEEKGLGYVGEDRLEAEEALQAGVTCLQACYIAAADVARCDCSTDGEAFDIHGVVNAAEELSGCIAYGEEALNRLEVFVEALVVLVDNEASEDCGKLVRAARDGVVGASVDFYQVFCIFAVIFHAPGRKVRCIDRWMQR